MKRMTPVIAALFLFTGCSSEPRSFEPADRSFAMNAVREQCKIVPRHSGTAGAEKTAEWIRKTASGIPGVKVRIDQFSDQTPVGNMTFRNVIAELPGRGKPVILAAHYDAKKLELSAEHRPRGFIFRVCSRRGQKGHTRACARGICSSQCR